MPVSIDLSGRTALVTGGANGIGLATVERLHDAGATVIACDVDRAALDSLQSRFSSDAVIPKYCDLSDSASIKGLISSTLNELGAIDILVNNAGFLRRTAFLDDDPTELATALSINLIGQLLTCQYVLPGMQRRQFGRIINVSSPSAIIGTMLEGGSNYAMAKAGLIPLTRTIANQFGKFNIRANVVLPGSVNTAMIRAALATEAGGRLIEMIPAGRIGHALDIANGILFLASSLAEHVNGHILTIDGGQTMRP